MTALWVAVLLLWIFAALIAAVVFAVWTRLTALALLYLAHTRDTDAHWSTKWEEDADA